MAVNQPPQNQNEAIPGYQIIGKLGSGGMGLVFKARDKNRRTVALKMLYPKFAANKASLDRFRREAELLIKFKHPNIVKGYHFGNAKGIYFLAMEYIDGHSVQDQIAEGRGFWADLPEESRSELIVNIILQVTRALDYIEKQGILHRDIKPDNLLMTDEGVIKLCDLGFAQPISSDKSAVSETTSGTAAYMSPEQARGQADLDIRSDIYALGATFYHMVTGKMPFSGGDNMEVIAQVVLESLKSDEIKNRKFPPLLLYFIEKMMAKDKDIRYQTPAEIIEDMEAQWNGFKSLEELNR
ncbi:MAG: serine/threonine-protein kinase [Candidatus Brocadiia bacterium]